MTSPDPPQPKPTPPNTALKARVETLEGQLKELAWYLGELQFVLKTIVAQAAMQQLGPMVQERMQQEIMDRLNAGGIASGFTPPPDNSSVPDVFSGIRGNHPLAR